LEQAQDISPEKSEEAEAVKAPEEVPPVIEAA